MESQGAKKFSKNPRVLARARPGPLNAPLAPGGAHPVLRVPDSLARHSSCCVQLAHKAPRLRSAQNFKLSVTARAHPHGGKRKSFPRAEGRAATQRASRQSSGALRATAWRVPCHIARCATARAAQSCATARAAQMQWCSSASAPGTRPRRPAKLAPTWSGLAAALPWRAASAV